ncbi:MAG: ribonuclease P protein subunit [Pyrodictiaceae archaeon]
MRPRRRRTPPLLNIIGLECKVVLHSDPSLVGVEGVIIDETKNTIRVLDKSSRRVKTILKKDGLFLIKLPSGREVYISGEELVGTLPERVRRRVRRVWM